MGLVKNWGCDISLGPIPAIIPWNHRNRLQPDAHNDGSGSRTQRNVLEFYLAPQAWFSAIDSWQRNLRFCLCSSSTKPGVGYESRLKRGRVSGYQRRCISPKEMKTDSPISECPLHSLTWIFPTRRLKKIRSGLAQSSSFFLRELEIDPPRLRRAGTLPTLVDDP